MDTNFWHQRWEQNEIAFHQREANPLLVKYFDVLSPSKGSRVFLPLCGKTLDIHWLLPNGYEISQRKLKLVLATMDHPPRGWDDDLRSPDYLPPPGDAWPPSGRTPDGRLILVRDKE